MRTRHPISDALEHVYAFDEVPGSWLKPGDIFGYEELIGEDHIGVRASSLCSCYSLHFKVCGVINLKSGSERKHTRDTLYS